MTAPTLDARLDVLARETHRRLVKNLRKANRDDAAGLADALDACTDQRPCNSGACPLCGRDFQLALVDLFKATIKGPAERLIRGRTGLLTAVPAIGSVDPDKLDADTCARVVADVTMALVACDLPPALLALDISFNDDSDGRVPPHWCVHAAGGVSNWWSDDQLKRLRKHFPPTKSITHPVDCPHLDRQPNGILYAYKPNRFRRESYTVSAVEGGRAAYRDTRRRELRPYQRVALALVEHEVGLTGRVISHGIDGDAVKRALDGFHWARDGP